MRQIVLGIVLHLFVGTLGVWAHDSSSGGTLADRGEPTLAAAIIPAAPGQLLVAAEPVIQLTPEDQVLSCSEVCTTFYAQCFDDCTETSCADHGCGFPNGYSSGTCYCSYCW